MIPQGKVCIMASGKTCIVAEWVSGSAGKIYIYMCIYSYVYQKILYICIYVEYSSPCEALQGKACVVDNSTCKSRAVKKQRDQQLHFTCLCRQATGKTCT